MVMLGGAAAEEMDDERDDGQDQENMNESTCNMERQPGNNPNNEQTERHYEQKGIAHTFSSS